MSAERLSTWALARMRVTWTSTVRSAHPSCSGDGLVGLTAHEPSEHLHLPGGEPPAGAQRMHAGEGLQGFALDDGQVMRGSAIEAQAG